MRDLPLTKKKIAIVGFATEDRDRAPFHDPDFEIWGLNMGHGWMPRWDRLFELHPRATIEQESMEDGTNYLAALQAEATRPIYMLDEMPDVPCSVRFPIEQFKSYVGTFCSKVDRQPYVTSTFAYMLGHACALLQQNRVSHWEPDGEEIHVYGVALLSGEEYVYQRENANFYAGFAVGRGIRLEVTDDSALLTGDGLYAYGNSDSMEMLARMRWYYEDKKRQLGEQRDAAATRRSQAMADYQTYDGALQQVDWHLKHLTYLLRGGKV